jgi:hypothetical protein
VIFSEFGGEYEPRKVTQSMKNKTGRSLSDCLEIAWMNVGSAGVDFELPDIISLADVSEQWKEFKQELLGNYTNGDYVPLSLEIVDLPKDRLAVRPLARLEIGHRLIYDALVVAAAPGIIKSVSYAVFSSWWWPKKQRFLSPIGRWIKMQRNARVFHLRHKDYLLALTDVSSFYEHIDIGILVGDLRRLGVPSWTLAGLEKFLTAFNRLSSAWGLPQGSDMSGLLANLYLTTLDAELRLSGCRHFRYSDDIYIFGKNWIELRQTLINANRTLRHRHLNLAAAKTKIVEGDDILKNLEDKEKDAINYGMQIEMPGIASEVCDLFDRATEATPVNVRDIKFSLTKLTKLKDGHAVDWICENLCLIPHAIREALVYLSYFIENISKIKKSTIDFLISGKLETYPYAQQHLLVFMIRNEIVGQLVADAVWKILFNKNAETFLREMAARYLGLFCLPGESGRLKQEYEREGSHRVRRALLIACYESSQCTEDWLRVISSSDPRLRLTADYLLRKPFLIPRPIVERQPWR